MCFICGHYDGPLWVELHYSLKFCSVIFVYTVKIAYHLCLGKYLHFHPDLIRNCLVCTYNSIISPATCNYVQVTN